MDSTPRAPHPPLTPDSLRVCFGAFLLDEREARISRDGSAIALPPKALAVLCVLVRNAGRLVSKDTLLDAVWGHRHVSESVLKSTVSQVRAALGDEAKQPRFVQTASGHGYRFIAELVGPLQPALPAATSASVNRPGSQLIGRDVDLSCLAAAWEDAVRGIRRVVWVSGEAGIGKTALLEHWLASTAPSRMARGHCIEPFGTGEPYLPLLEALATLCREDPRWPALVRQFAPAWLLQLPWLLEPGAATELRAMLAGASQDRMLRESCELLEHASRDEPLVLVLEDLHWSDVSTVRLLDYLARRRSHARLLILGSFRSTELAAAEHPLEHLRHELRVQGLATEIALDPLSQRDVDALLRGSWPGVADAQLAAALHAHTEGLPVFLVNVIADLRSRTLGHVPDTQACMQALALRVPVSLAGIINKQFGRLSREAQALLRAASVRGQVFSQRCVASVLSFHPEALQTGLSTLAADRQWIEEVGIERQSDGQLRVSYRFRHALYQQAICAQLGAVERVEAHRRLANDLAARVRSGEAVSAAEIALHFERGQALSDALCWLAEAAANALAQLAPREAGEHAERGLLLLDRLPPGADHAPLELSLHVTRGVAAAQVFGVGSAAALTDLERGRALSETLPHGPQHTWLLNGLGWIYFSRGDFPKAAAHGLAMQQRAEREGDALLALCSANLLGATQAYSGQLDDAQDCLDRALALLAGSGSAVATVRSIVDLETSVRVYRALVLAYRDLQTAAWLEAEAALARARALSQPMSLCLAQRCRCLLAIRRDDAEVVAIASMELLDLVSLHGVSQSQGPAYWYRGWSLARAGEQAAGLALVRQGIEHHMRLGMSTGLALAHTYAAQICLWYGEPLDARRHLLEGLSIARAHGETLDQAYLQQLLARAARC